MKTPDISIYFDKHGGICIIPKTPKAATKFYNWQVKLITGFIKEKMKRYEVGGKK